MNALSVIVDSSQTRILKDRLSTLVTGDDWSQRFGENVWIEPVTRSCLLLPLPYATEWATTGIGDYKRYTVADYTLTSSKWIDDALTGTSSAPIDNYIKGIAADGDNSEVVTTKAKQPRNGAMYLSWYGANAGSDDQVQMECGWGTPETAPISLRFYSGGKVDVYRFDEYQATYTINGAQQDQNPQQTANQFVSVTLHPFRRRELLIVSNRGGGAVHLFDDIDANDPDPEITPNMSFWWKVPSGLAKVSCAPCKFRSSGYICGTKSFFAAPPSASASLQTFTYSDANGGGTVASLCQPDDPTSTWTANDSDTITRVKIDLTGNGIRTPNLYGAICAYETITATTPYSPTILDAYLTKASLEVPDNACDLRWSIELKAPEALEAAGAIGIKTISNRPFSFTLGPITITNGVSEAPKLREGQNDGASRLSIDIRDKWKLCEHYLFTDPTPLDGLNLVDAFMLILNTAGIPSSLIELEPTTFTLPKSDAPSSDDGFAVLIKPGDTAADWLNRLHENYIATWFMGWVPTPYGWHFRLVSPETLGTTSIYTLYETVQDAIDASAALPDFSDHVQHTYRSYDQQTLEPECNDVWVIGRDLRTGKPLIGHKADTASQDPTIAVSLRPDNWLGEVRKYGLYDGSICSEDAVNQAVDILFNRLTIPRLIAEFTSDFLIKADGTPVWRGDVITLDGRGDYRIRSISTEFVREPDNSPVSAFWRPTKYTAELLNETPQGLHSLYGLSLTQILASHDLRKLTRSVVRSDDISRGLVKAKPLAMYLS